MFVAHSTSKGHHTLLSSSMATGFLGSKWGLRSTGETASNGCSRRALQSD